MDFLENEFNNRINKVSDLSRKMYINNLIKLNNNERPDNYEYLRDVYKIIEIIEEYKNSTQRNYLITIMTVLKHKEEYNEVYKKYYDIYFITNNNIKKDKAEHD